MTGKYFGFWPQTFSLQEKNHPLSLRHQTEPCLHAAKKEIGSAIRSPMIRYLKKPAMATVSHRLWCMTACSRQWFHSGLQCQSLMEAPSLEHSLKARTLTTRMW